jgi:hypothetical protein
MSHSDCATYGGLAHFKGDREAEAEHHRAELLRARELLTTNFPDIRVEPYFVKFDGVWQVMQSDSLTPAAGRPLRSETNPFDKLSPKTVSPSRNQ